MNWSDRSSFDETIRNWNVSTFPVEETPVRPPSNVIVFFIGFVVFLFRLEAITLASIAEIVV